MASSSPSSSFEACGKLSMDDDPHQPGSTIITILNIVNPKPGCFRLLQTRASEIDKTLSTIHLKFNEEVQLPSGSQITSALSSWKDLMTHENTTTTSSTLSDIKILLTFSGHPVKHVHEFLESFLSVNKSWIRNHLGKINVQSTGDSEDVVSAFKTFLENQGVNFALNEHQEEKHVDEQTGTSTSEQSSTSIQEETDTDKKSFMFSKSIVSSSETSSNQEKEKEKEKETELLKEGGIVIGNGPSIQTDEKAAAASTTAILSNNEPWSCEKCRLRTLRKKHRKEKRKHEDSSKHQKSRRKKKHHTRHGGSHHDHESDRHKRNRHY